MSASTHAQNVEMLQASEDMESRARDHAATVGLKPEAAAIAILTMALGRAIARLVIDRGGDERSLKSAVSLGLTSLALSVAAQFQFLRSLAAAAGDTAQH